ncbi:phenolic acid decarboxylase [Zymobacter palmae]|uniref:Phenolic acid decarboxylase n=1 Tax=Zymobacter palmae TaxID=33074 RepID=A0A348HBZ1_9GAMM|nr:phenolic acid decarboxylase [Zymobacter palmae]BBG29143.1 phenolic acid decarboxylase [Zymobacter palmae]
MHDHYASLIAHFVGQHILYTYENGWCYEMYIKQADRVDYRIHSGDVGGHWVKSQPAHIACIAEDIFKVTWEEPTGTAVCLVFNLRDGLTHGTAFFPRWIADAPQKTVCFQNQHLDEMRTLRDAGPIYPMFVLDEYSQIKAMENRGAGNEAVIHCAPSELPADYIEALCQRSPFKLSH